MNNKDKLFLANLQVALREFIGMDIGKAAKADLAAIEKAAGGKKKLDEADKVLEKARAEYDNLITLAQSKEVELLKNAEASIQAIRNGLAERERAVSVLEAAAEVTKGALLERTQKLNDIAKELEDLKTQATERDDAAALKESQVSIREAKATAREGEIRAFDTWRATAP